MSWFESVLHKCEGAPGCLGVDSLGRLEGSPITSLGIKTAVGVRRERRAGLLLVAKLVANAPNGQDHLRVLRVLFNLGAQPVDV